MSFSGLEKSMEKMRVDTEVGRMATSVRPWPPEEDTEAARQKRLKKAAADFWYFDRTYFPPEAYQEHAEISAFHRKLFQIAMGSGVNVVAAARSHGKTVTMKKIFAWLLLTGQVRLGATLSATLTPSQNILQSIKEIITENARVAADWKAVIHTDNLDEFRFHIPWQKDVGYRQISAFSEDRSLRGASAAFYRPEYVLADDLETLASPIGGEHTEHRIKVLAEAFASLAGRACVVALGNNFHEDGYINYLWKLSKEGLLEDKWRVFIFPAWRKGRPLWPQKYNVTTEAELRKAVGAMTEDDWQNNYQQNPTPVVRILDVSKFGEYTRLPAGSRGIIYCDQNLAQKGKGDTTAIVAMWYNSRLDQFYFTGRCKSYADANVLIDDMLELYDPTIHSAALDGNVNQESHWKQHLRAWAIARDRNPPHVEFRRYSVDQLATNFQTVLNSGRVNINSAFKNSPEGREFLRQVGNFVSKKAGKKDDAPDALISAYQYMQDRKIVRAAVQSGRKISVFTIAEW